MLSLEELGTISLSKEKYFVPKMTPETEPLYDLWCI